MRNKSRILGTILSAAMLAAATAGAQSNDDDTPPGPAPGITQIAFDPFNASLAYSIDTELGILQSFDGGMTWSPTGPIDNAPSKDLYRVMVADNGAIMVGTVHGSVYASYDGGVTWDLAPGSGYAAITVDIAYLGGGDSIPAGQPGRFRVSIHNAGPDFSTNTRVWFAWFRSPLFGHTVGYEYTMNPSQGRCSRSITPEPDCYVDTIATNGSMQIDFNGNTEPNRLGWYTLRVWVESDQAAKTLLGESSLGTSVTIAESGGGSTGIGFLLLTAAALLFCSRAGRLSNRHSRVLAHID